MKNWKTSLFGILGLVTAAIHVISGNPVDETTVTQVITGIGLLAAKDFNVTGGKIQQ